MSTQHFRRKAEALHQSGRLKLNLTRLDALVLPPSKGLPSLDRLRAMCLGVAIGDSLGNTSESQSPSARRQRHGWIAHYLPNRHAEGRCVGLPSDDTQLTFWTLRSFLRCGKLDLAALAEEFQCHRIFGIGRTMKAWLARASSGHDPWDARQCSAGNGAVMRVVGLLAPHVSQPGSDRWLWEVILGSALTHDDPTSTASCVAFAALLEYLLHSQRIPSASDIFDLYVGVMQVLEGEPQLQGRVTEFPYSGPCYRLVDRMRHRLDQSASEVGKEIHSGAFLLETMPSTIHLIAKYREDPQLCILAAVNETWDNDTIASMCAAAMGALHGTQAFRTSWMQDLPGRTTDRDEAEVFRILDPLCHRLFIGESDASRQQPGTENR